MPGGGPEGIVLAASAARRSCNSLVESGSGSTRAYGGGGGSSSSSTTGLVVVVGLLAGVFVGRLTLVIPEGDGLAAEVDVVLALYSDPGEGRLLAAAEADVCTLRRLSALVGPNSLDAGKPFSKRTVLNSSA
jgi:hypothetical protein